MIEIKQSISNARVPVRLVDSAGAPLSGIAYTDVIVTVEKSDGTVIAVLVTSDNWIEVSTGAFAGTGKYSVKLPSSAVDTAGVLAYAVAATGAVPYLGVVKVVAAEAADAKAVTDALRADYTTTRAAKLDNMDVATSTRAPATEAVSNTQLTEARILKLDYLDNLSVISAPYVSFTGSGQTDAPVIHEVFAPRRNQVRVTFSEPVVMTPGTNGALNVNNYLISGLTVYSAARLTDVQVLLTTTTQLPGTVYNLTVVGVEDLEGNPVAGS